MTPAHKVRELLREFAKTLDASASARAVGIPERTAREWVRDWYQRQGEQGTPVVTLAPPSSGRGRTRYVVDRASLFARFPRLMPHAA